MNARTVLTFLSVLLPALASAAGATPDARVYSGPAWSPYMAGIGIGVLTWLTFRLSNQAVGASSAYATIAGMLGKVFAQKHTENLEYFRKNPPKLNWEFLFLVGTVGGAVVAAWHGGELTQRWLSPMWEERFGEGSLLLRGVIGFLGGLLMAMGARLAGGCTSGHGISGTLQLSVASWISVMCFFVGGAIVANILF